MVPLTLKIVFVISFGFSKYSVILLANNDSFLSFFSLLQPFFVGLVLSHTYG